MRKRTILTAMIISTAITLTASAAGLHSTNWYKKLIRREKIGAVREYWNEDVTSEVLTNRGDDIIIEKIIGTVIDRKGNGRVMNPADPDYDYISYKHVKGAHKGDVVLTVCIYTPGNTYEDDVCERFDYIIDRTAE